MTYYDGKKNKLKISHYVTKIKNIPKDTIKIIFLEDHDRGQYSLFNRPINNLPNSIIDLRLGCFFNQIIKKFPESIKYLKFGCEFNQPIDNLPNSVTHLILGAAFNNPIDKLPNSITYLTVGNNFNQLVENLPISITDLNLGYKFNQPIDKLPMSIKNLSIFTNSNLVNNIPNNVEEIFFFFTPGFSTDIENIPPTVKKITINDSTKIQLIKKLPFECIVFDKFNNQLDFYKKIEI